MKKSPVDEARRGATAENCFDAHLLIHYVTYKSQSKEQYCP